MPMSDEVHFHMVLEINTGYLFLVFSVLVLFLFQNCICSALMAMVMKEY